MQLALLLKKIYFWLFRVKIALTFLSSAIQFCSFKSNNPEKVSRSHRLLGYLRNFNEDVSVLEINFLYPLDTWMSFTQYHNIVYSYLAIVQRY